MTTIINYGNITWPELAEIPSETPIILPLGDYRDYDQISEELGNPPILIILPSLPFGWKNSLIEVKEVTFTRLIRNLLQSLREDGFHNLHVLSPIELSKLKENNIISSKQLNYTKYNNIITSSLDVKKVLLLPTGHVEQHSYHLPMITDTMIIDSISRDVVQAIPDLCEMLPVMPYGVSTHRSSFLGTINLGGRVYEDFWLEVLTKLVKIGFDRFYFLNGHGGNSSFLVNIAKYIGEKFPGIFCATSWLYLSGPDGVNSLEKNRTSPIGGMGHAGELETSLMLHINKNVVHMDRVHDDMDFISTPSYYMDWIEGGALIANPPWYDDSKYGAYGAGSMGTSEKGSIWLRDAVKEKVSHILEINQQQNMREERRKSGYGEWASQKYIKDKNK